MLQTEQNFTRIKKAYSVLILKSQQKQRCKSLFEFSNFENSIAPQTRFFQVYPRRQLRKPQEEFKVIKIP